MDHSFTLCAFADEAAQTLDGQISAMRDNGIGWLELRGVDGVNVSQLSEADAQRIRTALDANGLRVWSIGSPTGKIDIADDFAPHLDSFRHMVCLADILGASHYRLFSFYGTGGSATARDAVLERLSRIAEAAAGSGLTLCHENEKDIYGETAEACLEIHTALPAIRAVFDPANFVQAGRDTAAAWELLEPYVEYMHIKDALADGRVVLPGEGCGRLPMLIDRYRSSGGGMLTLEPHLADFVGLGGLERDRKSEIGYAYSSLREAFDAAAAALKALINR